MGGHLSGVGKHDDDMDLSAEYGPGIQNTTRDWYGTRGDDDPVRERGEHLAERLPGSGVSRRLSNDAALATDEDLMSDIEREIIAEYGGAHIKIGAFGR
jgi:hypothetical protein